MAGGGKLPEPRIRYERKESIGLLVLDRPEKLNAIDLDALAALERTIAGIEADRLVRAVVLAGEGRAFSTGGDIRAWSGMSPADFGFDWVRYGHRVFSRLAQLRVPVIAALEGAVLGGGLELAATADIRIAGEGVRFGLPEAGLGMVPGWSGTQRLVRRFGQQVVRRMALGGEVIDAAEGLRLGLVDRICPAGEAREMAEAHARDIAGRGPQALAAVKLMINAAEGEEREAALETLASMHIAGTPDLGEGVAAFLEKRRPDFSGEEK